MSLLCKIFGHRMYFDSHDVSGPSTCKRCGHKEAGIDWGDRVPMPDVKPPKQEKCNSCTNRYNGTNGNGYQPCGCDKQAIELIRKQLEADLAKLHQGKMVSLVVITGDATRPPMNEDICNTKSFTMRIQGHAESELELVMDRPVRRYARIQSETIVAFEKFRKAVGVAFDRDRIMLHPRAPSTVTKLPKPEPKKTYFRQFEKRGRY